MPLSHRIIQRSVRLITRSPSYFAGMIRQQSATNLARRISPWKNRDTLDESRIKAPRVASAVDRSFNYRKPFGFADSAGSFILVGARVARSQRGWNVVVGHPTENIVRRGKRRTPATVAQTRLKRALSDRAAAGAESAPLNRV